LFASEPHPPDVRSKLVADGTRPGVAADRKGLERITMAQRTQRRTPRSARPERSTCLSATAAALASTVHPHDAPLQVGATKGSAQPVATGWIRSSHRLLMMRGLSSIEASNVVAYIAGLHPASEGWSIRQIQKLVALRSLVACGVIAS
jgi:hypothetical protein